MHWNCLLWNVEWAKTRKARQAITDSVASVDLDLVCLTEAITELLPDSDNVIKSGEDYGYPNPGSRRKVMIWSRCGWSDVDAVGHFELPPGRFVTGVTAGVRVVGVCVPWAMAHVTSGRRDQRQWAEHRAYLSTLAPLLHGYVGEGRPLVLLGDFNQPVPPSGRTADVYGLLRAALGGALTVQTAGVVGKDGNLLIDHVATTHDITVHEITVVNRNASDGVHISDHDGVRWRMTVPSG